MELLLTGHEHLYEHWVERYRDSTGAARRIDQIVTGGGTPLYSYQGEPDLRSYVRMALRLTRFGWSIWCAPG